MTPELQRILAAKERRRRELAALSFPEKIEIVIALQQMAAPMERQKGRTGRVWMPAAGSGGSRPRNDN